MENSLAPASSVKNCTQNRICTRPLDENSFVPVTLACGLPRYSNIAFFRKCIKISEAIHNKGTELQDELDVEDRHEEKACLQATATSKIPGVITVNTQPTDSPDKVMQMVLQNLTNLRVTLFDPTAYAKRVIAWHRFFTFGRTPIVAISPAGPERRGDPSLKTAVRSLVDDYGLHVLVDSSPNSFNPNFLRSDGLVVEIGPMSKEMIWALPQLKDLVQVMNQTGVAEIAWAVLGGIPAKYENVWFRYNRRLTNGKIN